MSAAQVDRIRRQVDTGMWTAVGLGLAFTAVNVQTFAAAGAPVWSGAWSVAWLLDPMVSVLLISVLRAEQFTSRWQIAMTWQVTAVKWGAFASTYAMNTWASWRDAVPSGVVLHSVPPLVVLLGAGVAPVLRDRLTAAGHATAASTSGAADEHASPLPTQAARRTPVMRDPRVAQLADDLTTGEGITGPIAAVRVGCSERTARRLLAEARTHLEQATSAHTDLHLVDAEAAGEPR